MSELVRDILDGWRSRPARALALAFSGCCVALALGHGSLRLYGAWSAAENILASLPLDEQVLRFPGGISTEAFADFRRAVAPARVQGQSETTVQVDDQAMRVQVWIGDVVPPGGKTVAGRFLDHEDLRESMATAVLDARRAGGMGYRPGDMITVGEQAVELVGLADLAALGVDMLLGWSGEDRSVEELRVWEAGNFQIHARVQRLLQQPDWSERACELLDRRSLRQAARKSRNQTLSSLVGLGVLLSGLVLLLQVHLYDAEVRERQEEIGLRRSLGARPGQIQGLFFVEAVLLGVLGSGAAAVTMPDGRLALLGFAGVLCLNVLAVFFPARRAARLSPIDCLRS